MSRYKFITGIVRCCIIAKLCNIKDIGLTTENFMFKMLKHSKRDSHYEFKKRKIQLTSCKLEIQVEYRIESELLRGQTQNIQTSVGSKNVKNFRELGQTSSRCLAVEQVYA